MSKVAQPSFDNGVILEHQLHSKLHLARRPRFTSWKPGVRDSARAGTPGDISRLSEIRVIKNIEELGAKLHAHPIAELGVLH